MVTKGTIRVGRYGFLMRTQGAQGQGPLSREDVQQLLHDDDDDDDDCAYDYVFVVVEPFL
jgi:hypothetical protein